MVKKILFFLLLLSFNVCAISDSMDVSVRVYDSHQWARYNFTANVTKIINATNQTNVIINITTNANITNCEFFIGYTADKPNPGIPGYTRFDKYIVLEPCHNLTTNLSFMQIKAFYEDWERKKLVGTITESTLVFFRWNKTEVIWLISNPTGVDQQYNFVWTKTDKFGLYGIFGIVPPEICCDGIDNDGDGLIDEDCICRDVGCVHSWKCSEWTECINNRQTRTCENIGTCVDSIRPPSLIRDCVSEKDRLRYSKWYTNIENGSIDEKTEEKDETYLMPTGWIVALLSKVGLLEYWISLLLILLITYIIKKMTEEKERKQ